LENYLCPYSREENIIRDEDGNVILDCMCGAVINEQTNIDLSFFSEGGSFYTNCTTELIKKGLPPEWDRKTRKQCNIEGYECVMVVPLKSGNEVVGTLQLNDRRKDLFNDELIEFYESIGNSVGIILKNKQVKEDLEKEKILNKNYIDIANVMMLSLDLQGNLVFANKKTCKVLNYSEEEIIGKNWIENFIPKFMRDDLYSVFLKNISNDNKDRIEIESYENPVITSTGELRYIRWHNSYIEDMFGNIVGTLSSGDDITEEKKVKIKLQESEERYRTFVENFHGIAYRASVSTWTPLFFHGAVEDITGYTEKDFLKGKPTWDKIIHPDDFKKLFGKNEVSKIENFSMEREYRIIRKDGTIRWVRELSNNKIFSKNGTTYIQGALYDITDKIKAEEELKELAHGLQRSNSELEEFAYIASHDIQEPLRIVTTYCQLLEAEYNDKIDEDGKVYMGYIIEYITRMQYLIKELLEFSRVGKKDKPIEIVDINDLVNDVKKDFAITIKENNIKIKTKKLPSLNITRVRIRQLFHNLLSNSIKFRNKNTNIKISAFELIDCWEFCFKDNGIGISKKHHNRIFKPFKRLYTRDEYPGTGIGLAMCKKIVESHGGRIWVESEKGEGSAFYFTLPKKNL